ncbi:MFS transporter [Kribbella kalugense]|uniref:Putative MFS family arabinose efflux permease n=1 Tax=Kribbella kalugense TaxID=2512221 RepID=A0A4R8A061_9ACTN|nr:MFS transporter [Kribbella kalugense]TDW23752.1 putative MFS family arabinose efflux permease [Kribbella kalugense]
MSLLKTHRDFRLFWIGETINRFGSATSSVALPLVAISLLDATTFEVGLLTAAAWAPWLLIGLPTGAWIDRVRRRPVMLASCVASFLLFAAVPLAATNRLLTIQLLLAIAGLAGAASVLFQTAYTAYLPTLLDQHDHAEGNAKLHGSASAAQIAGMGCGGLLVQFAGAANALLVDAASFLVAGLCLAAIRYRERRTTNPRKAGAIREGIRLVAHDVWLRTLTIFGAASNLALMGYQAIIVVFLVREAGLTAGSVGALVAAASSGGVVGAFIGRHTLRFGTARALLLCELGLPTLALLIPLSGASPWFYLVGAFGVSLGVVGGNVVKTTFLQSYCPADLLGRLTATTAFVNYGTIPLGALLGGTLGQTLGLTPALWITTAGVPLAGLVLIASPIRKVRDLPAHQGSGVPGATADSNRVRTA